MRGFRRSALLLSVLFYAVPSAATAEKNAQPSEYKVGLVTRDIQPTARRNWRGQESHTLHFTVWYPAVETAIETPQAIGPPGQRLFDAGSAMPHAGFAPTLEKLPLVLISHGSGGSALQMAWLGTALARAGFIAAAVDHPGNNSVTGYTPEGFILWWERATDLSEVLDGLLADPELGSKIDRERIGVAGFSLGGYTSLVLAGARTDISTVFELCKKDPANAVCNAPEMKGMGSAAAMLTKARETSGESLARSADSFRDPRIRAVFAVAPGLGLALTRDSLRGIRIPVELVVGSADPLAPAPANATYIRQSVRGARETILPGPAHYTFLDTCTDAGKASLGVYCADPAGVDRTAVHREVGALAVQFFRRELR